MSYIRFSESNWYIYGTVYKGINAIQFYGDELGRGLYSGVMISDDSLDVWLACVQERGDELAERIAHGKALINGEVEPQRIKDDED